MPLQTLGGVAVREAISHETARILKKQYGHALRAVILTGSLARDEASLLHEADRIRVLGDADILVIFDKGHSLPDRVETEHLATEIAESILSLGVECQIGLSPVHPAFLRHLRPHSFAYELRTLGKVIAGDPQVLELVRPFDVSDIPLEDAWWTLCNRMIEVLEVIDPQSTSLEPLPLKLQYRCAKLWTDMATSFLLFVGEYAPTSRERVANLAQFARKGKGMTSAPFALPEFSSTVAAATSWRLDGCRGKSPVCSWRSLKDTAEFAHALWRWELAILSGGNSDASDSELWRQYTRRSSRLRRLRGWAFVVRERGWHRSWKQWPRWMRLAQVASPRHWIYAAGSELFFTIPTMSRGHLQLKHLDSLQRCLPESSIAGAKNWISLAQNVASNYHQFAVSTRS